MVLYVPTERGETHAWGEGGGHGEFEMRVKAKDKYDELGRRVKG